MFFAEHVCEFHLCVQRSCGREFVFSLLDFRAILSQARRLSDAKVVGKTKRLTFTFER